MAVHYARACPGKRFAILEKRAAIGGTWDLFRYPGIRSDSDMFTLSFDFHPWTAPDSIAGGESIRGYLEEVIDAHRLRDHIRLDQAVHLGDVRAQDAVRLAPVGTARDRVEHRIGHHTPPRQAPRPTLGEPGGEPDAFQRFRCERQSAGTAPAGPGAGWSAGWLSAGARRGPLPASSVE